MLADLGSQSSWIIIIFNLFFIFLIIFIIYSLNTTFNILSPILWSFLKGTSTTAGPSGISAQHFATSACICASLKGAVNIRVSGKAPISVSSFLAGGRLIALNKNKEGSPPDVNTTQAGKKVHMHMCHPKEKNLWYLSIIEDYCLSEDFVNAFNRVSRQEVLNECGTFPPELLSAIGIGSHTLWCHPLGSKTSSQSGVYYILLRSLVHTWGFTLINHFFLQWWSSPF